MSEKIQIKNGKVKCQMIGAQTAAHNCKKCEHCRIALGDYIKCNYSADAYKAEHKTVQSFNI